MKQYFYFIVIILIFSTFSYHTSAQTFVGNLYLNSQAEVDAFDFTEVTGTLEINGSDITNLAGLSELETVGSNLSIRVNPMLPNLNGLDNLTSVGLQLSINGNATMTSLSGLGSSLTSVGGTLLINGNLILPNLSGLENLTSIGLALLISGNAGLTSLTGLDNLTSVGNRVEINTNSSLASLSGLDNLTSIGQQLHIRRNSALTSLSGPQKLNSVGSYLRIEDNDALTNLNGLESITSIGQYLQVDGNAMLTSLNGLEGLTSIGTYIFLAQNPQLTTLSGINNADLSSINFIQTSSNPLLSTCELFNVCDAVVNFNRNVVFNGSAPNSPCSSKTALETACVPILLPVEFMNFQVMLFDNRLSKISWQTASEINNEGFEIERSPDGKNWENIGFEVGNGTTQETQDYEFIDERPLSGINYYRLKQIDFDGKFEYSDIQSVHFQNGQNTPIQVFPNPVKDGNLTVKLDQFGDEEITIQIYDLTGKTWLQRTSYDTTTELNVQDLTAGVYFLQINANGQTARQKIVIE